MSLARIIVGLACCWWSVASAAEVKPVLTLITPRGIQSGTTSELTLVGTALGGSELVFSDARVRGVLIAPAANSTAPWRVKVTIPRELQRGALQMGLRNASGESARLTLHIDDVPQVIESDRSASSPETLSALPLGFWGALSAPGEVDRIAFESRAGETFVFDAQSTSLGSKAAELVLSLVSAEGRVLAVSRDRGEPWLVHTFSKAGRFALEISELQRNGSPDHFYRVTSGALPVVMGFYPPTIAAARPAKLELIGYNLPEDFVEITPPAPGDFPLSLDPTRFRIRGQLKPLATALPDLLEREPNGKPAQAQALPVPGAICGRFWREGAAGDEADLYRFHAKAGQSLILETSAGRVGSPADTRLDVLYADGRPVPRVRLQAVRNSAINFRPINSTQADGRVDHWEEMELNEYLYMEGEVVRLLRAPEGPDSGFRFYTGPTGSRRGFFDTSASAHADGSTCYIVHPLSPSATPQDNGLPLFMVHYANDDDSLRQWGTDSRLTFTAPREEDYLVRVTDNRRRSGPLYSYRLLIRQAQPDFRVTLAGDLPTVAPGSGKGFTVRAERMDGFDGPIRVELPPAPPGLSLPRTLVIEAGHTEAHGVVFAADDAPAGKPISLAGNFTAIATLPGGEVRRALGGLGTIKVDGKPALYVGLEKDASMKARDSANATIRYGARASTLSEGAPLEITLAPGGTAPIWIALQRVTEKGLQDISVANLPHGVIVDSIGLNGVEIAENQDRREVFLRCAPWVAEMDRLCFAVLGGSNNVVDPAGKQTSLPVLLRIRRP